MSNACGLLFQHVGPSALSVVVLWTLYKGIFVVYKKFFCTLTKELLRVKSLSGNSKPDPRNRIAYVEVIEPILFQRQRVSLLMIRNFGMPKPKSNA